MHVIHACDLRSFASVCHRTVILEQRDSTLHRGGLFFDSTGWIDGFSFGWSKTLATLGKWRFEVRGKIWYWEREDAGGQITRMGPFQNFILCMIDAERHGYDPGGPETKYSRVRPVPPRGV
jgi:hypothetical protein